MVEVERYRTQDYDLNRVQDKVELFASELQQSGIIAGRLFEDIEVTRSDTFRVYHGLNRKPKGYIVVSTTVAGTVIIKNEENVDPKNYLPLQMAANSIISLWVF